MFKCQDHNSFTVIWNALFRLQMQPLKRKVNMKFKKPVTAQCVGKLVGNDTVSISKWCGGDVRSTECCNCIVMCYLSTSPFVLFRLFNIDYITLHYNPLPITLTLFSMFASYSHVIHITQIIKVKSQLVPKIEWKQTNVRTRPIALPFPLLRALINGHFAHRIVRL